MNIAKMLMVRYGKSNALYNFFKFQDIAIQVTNKKGNSELNNPNVFDYYVDTPNVANIMSLLTYVGIGVASVATRDIFAIIYFVARNKKLKKILILIAFG